jgi:acetolactate decarboxylase
MQAIHCEIPSSLWLKLCRHTNVAGVTVQEAVTNALKHYLEEDSAIYQVSTSAALVEGVYKGAVDVRTLKEHGDLGLGTFEDLDGEMIAIDGHFFQAKSDGTVEEVSDTILTPFAIVTRFNADHKVRSEQIENLSDLTNTLDKLRTSENVFFAFRITGTFERVHARAVCKTKRGVPLIEAAAHQPEFEFKKIEGTLVGFWSPQYASSVDIPGYHLHFISSDRSKGGHVLDCSGKDVLIEIHKEGSLILVLPETEDFLKADLTHDPSAALEKAEKGQQK